MVKAGWGRDGDFTGVDEQSLWRLTGSSPVYEEAWAALSKPPYRWGEWVAVFHPTFAGQIVGYRRLRPKDWFTFNLDTGNIRGPFPTKRHGLRAIRESSSSTVEAGVYLTAGHYVFTRDKAARINVKEEELL